MRAKYRAISLKRAVDSGALARAKREAGPNALRIGARFFGWLNRLMPYHEPLLSLPLSKPPPPVSPDEVSSYEELSLEEK